MSTLTKTRPAGRALRATEWLLLLIGLLTIGLWLWSVARTAFVQARESRLFDREVQQQLEAKPTPFIPEKRQGAASHAPVEPPPLPLGKDGLLGRLSIPRIGLAAMVREGDSESTLSVALGHIPGTALPGQNGNVGIAGHRDTLFRRLSGIQRDDTIVFETLRGAYRYRVDSLSIVEPADIEVLSSAHAPELTLVTCYPFTYIGAAPKRFIVKASLLASPGAVASADIRRVSSPRRLHPLKHHTGNLVAAENY